MNNEARATALVALFEAIGVRSYTDGQVKAFVRATHRLELGWFLVAVKALMEEWDNTFQRPMPAHVYSKAFELMGFSSWETTTGDDLKTLSCEIVSPTINSVLWMPVFPRAVPGGMTHGWSREPDASWDVESYRLAELTPMEQYRLANPKRLRAASPVGGGQGQGV